MTQAKRTTVLADLDNDYGKREGHVCIAYRDRSLPNDFGQKFFVWPAQRSDVATFIRDRVEAGCCVWKPTSLLDEPARRQSKPSNVLSFEVDQELMDEAWKLLDEVGATLIGSGTPGHVHVKVKLDRLLPHDELAGLAEHLARACGITGASDSGGKWQPHDLLRVVGTFNTKHDPPVEVAIMRQGEGTSVEALRSALAPYDVDVRSPVGAGLLDAEEIAWDAVPPGVRAKYREIAHHDDRSDAFWFFLERCVSRDLTPGQTLWLCLDDPKGLVPDRYSRDSLEKQIVNAFDQPSSTDKVNEGKEKTTNLVTNDNTPQPRKLWGYSDLMKAKFPPIRYVVHNLIKPGVTVVVGAPKVGKTFWLLNLVLAVASGRQVFGHFDTRQTGVLYMYLEGGGAATIQSRVVSQADEHDEDLPITFATEWRPFADHGLDKLDEWLEAHDDVGLVVIDTLAAFRSGGKADRDIYKADYELLKQMSTIAHRHRCAIVVSTHDKKGEVTDFVDSVSGTKGVTGGGDGIIRLDRDKGEGGSRMATGSMTFVGREIEDGFWRTYYDGSNWVVKGAPPLKKGSDTLREIIEVLGNGRLLGSEIRELMEARGHSAGAVRQCLSRALRARNPRLKQDNEKRYYAP